MQPGGIAASILGHMRKIEAWSQDWQVSMEFLEEVSYILWNVLGQ